MKKTKIICTMGPKVEDDGIIREMMLKGMNCSRHNFSHGDFEEHKARIDRIKRVRKELGKSVAILLDTKGPEIRLKTFENEAVELEKGQKFTLKQGDVAGTKDFVAVTYDNLSKDVKVGDTILIDDGKIGLNVDEINGTDVVCTVKNGGRVSDRKSINIPGVSIKMEYLSEKDKADIIFGISQDIDFIAASFVRTAQDVLDIRKVLKENNGEGIKIISKIENMEGIENLDSILEVTDGIMVARGDLGVEIPYDLLPGYQKQIIEKCYRKGKLVVTATQMLESMTKNPRPTRAEVSDVANAVYDNTCCIMLSGETAAGDYPTVVVDTMATIARSTENSIDYKKWYHEHELDLGNDVPNAIAKAACSAAHSLDAKAIVVLTKSGKTAELISAYRPACPIIAAVVDERGMRQLNLAWNVKSIKAEAQNSADVLFDYAIEEAVKSERLEEGDTIIIVAGSSYQAAAPANMMRISTLTKEDIEKYSK